MSDDASIHPVDLHMHTFFSDGWKPPEDVVVHAASLGIGTIAITDHDNMRGSRVAAPVAAEQDVRLIPAVELTTHWQDDGWDASVDLLAYFVDPDNEDFQKVLDDALADVTVRIEACCAELMELGYPVTMADVYGQNPRYAGAGPLIYAMMERGVVRNFGDGLNAFREAWGAVPPPALTIEAAIQAVHCAGGVTVLAHPTRIPRNRGRLTQAQLRGLVDAGLDGMEMHHPSLDAEARDHYRVLADHFDLLVSGGSDEHAFGGSFKRMGTQPVTKSMLDALEERAGRYR